MRRWEYYQWNYGTHTVIQWERHGKCNRCGECCKAHIAYFYGGEGIGDWATMGETVGNQEGIWLEARRGKQRFFMSPVKIDMNVSDHECSAFVCGKCLVHKEKGKRAPLCDLWPINPSQVEVFQTCSYSFTQIGEESFDDHQTS